MKDVFSLLIMMFACCFVSSSQGIDNGNFVVTHGPYLQNLSETGVTIIWTTSKPAVPGVKITYPDGKNRFVRNSEDGLIDGGGLLHKVRVDGLEPGKTYKYSINSVQILKYQAYQVYYGDTLNRKSENFITPSGKSEKVSFTVINDVHENSGKLASYIRNGNREAQNFYIFNGDMVDFLQSENQLFPGFIDSSAFYFAAVKPFYYVRGNHETRGFAARQLKNYFDYRDDRFYYSFDYGPVHFTVLDCGEDKPDNNRYYFGLADYDSYRNDELGWLKDEIISNNFKNAKYRIVVIHMPVIKEDKQGYGMKYLSEYFGPVLKTAGINLMMSAHTHRNTYYEPGRSGFGYPVLVNSNNSFVEVDVDLQGITAVVKDIGGKIINTYNIK